MDLHFIENAVRRKRSHAPTLTLFQAKCGLKASLGDFHLRIMRTELKVFVVVFDEVSRTDLRCLTLFVCKRCLGFARTVLDKHKNKTWVSECQGYKF